MNLIGPLFCKVCNVAIPHENARESHNQGKRHQLALHAEIVEDTSHKATVFSKGWPNAVKKEEIVKFMSQFGEIESNYKPTQNTWMFTKFKNVEDAQNLILRGKVKFYERNITFSAKKKPEKQMPAPQEENIYKPVLKIIYNQKSFGDEILTLAGILQPNPQHEIDKYLHLCKDLEVSVRYLYPGARVHPFGSTITGLAFRDSDVDAFIAVPNAPQYPNKLFYVEAVNRTRDILARNALFASVFAIPRAKTPIVKCVHMPTGIKCDMNFKNMLGVCNSYFIQFVMRLDVKLKLCMLALKFWSRLMIGDAGNRLSNYALSIMFIYYLQQPPYLLPTIRQLQEKRQCWVMQDGWNGGFDREMALKLDSIRNASVYVLLHDFFKFYLAFNFVEDVICPYLGRPVKKTCFTNVEHLPEEFQQYRVSYRDEHLKQSDLMCQDPFEHNRNVTGSLCRKLVDEFLDELKRGLAILDSQVPHLLYTLCSSEMVDGSHQTIRMKMPKLKFLKFLLRDDADATNSIELKEAWFEFVEDFLRHVLTDIFKLTLNVDGAEAGNNAAKKMKTDTNDLSSFTVSGSYNLWEARSGIREEEVAFPRGCDAFLERQVVISEYIQRTLLKDVVPKVAILRARVAVQHELQDSRVVITLDAVEGEMGNEYFGSFAYYLANVLPAWLVQHTKEKNEKFRPVSDVKIKVEKKIDAREEEVVES